MRFDLRHGDSREVLRSIDAESIDALVTDPPAGIKFMGVGWDTFSERKGSNGHDRSVTFDRAGGNHNPINNADKVRTLRSEGAKFRAALQPIFEECLRVLKPGAHGLVWAIPRTSHWTATALEDAGFEIRDRVSYLHGTGFPKSLNVSKALDKAAGAEREVLGPSSGGCPGGRLCTHGGNTVLGGTVHAPTTAPATALAREWDGWGTALKPACEDWWLVRKPLSGTVAANVAEHGTGALNIDACRIGLREARELNRGATTGSGLGYASGSGPQSVVDGGAGRWPANVTLDEEAAALLDAQSGECPSEIAVMRNGGGCQIWGDTNRIGPRPDAGYTDSGGASRFFATFKQENECPLCGSAIGAGETSRPIDNGDASAGSPAAEASTQAQARDCSAPSTSATPNGSRPRSDPPTETMPLFGNECSPESPHARRSLPGNHANGAEMPGPIGITTTTASRSRSAGSAAVAISSATPRSAEDGAGLLGGSTRFLYTPKPDRGERDIGCEDLPAASGGEATGRVDGSAGTQNPRAGAGRNGGARNIHPTVKSVDLMRWLCRLVTPKGGLVLDPFMGSGSTGIACAREGMRFIGIERERAYFEIARRRIVGDAPLLNRIEQLPLEGPDRDPGEAA